MLKNNKTWRTHSKAPDSVKSANRSYQQLNGFSSHKTDTVDVGGSMPLLMRPDLLGKFHRIKRFAVLVTIGSKHFLTFFKHQTSIPSHLI